MSLVRGMTSTSKGRGSCHMAPGALPGCFSSMGVLLIVGK